MSDDFEELLRHWLRDRAGNDRSAVQALAGHVAGLPPRRRRRPAQLATAAGVLVALGLGAFLLAPRFGSNSAPEGATPPDPAAFAGDRRLDRCGANVATASAAFEMVHARDYRRHMPAMGLAPELDVDDAGFVVVYSAMQPFGGGGAAPLPGQTRAPRSLAPGLHDICVLVGADPATAEMNIYTDVDTTGLTIDVVPTSPSAVPSPDTSPSDAPPSATVAPAPAWVLDLAGQLDCDGPVANLGSEYPEAFGGPDPLGADPEAALGLFLGPGNMFASLPAAGFTEYHADPHWASFAHIVDGRPKAIIVLTDTTEFGAVWSVVALRACDASEFDPAVPLTFPVTIWKDGSGNAVSTETIRSNPGPGHCGWDSAIWLHVGGELYFRDPQGVMAEWTRTGFESDAELPTRAVDSGYRSGEWSLWLDPGGDAYLVSSGHVERWPRSSDPFIGCM